MLSEHAPHIVVANIFSYPCPDCRFKVTTAPREVTAFRNFIVGVGATIEAPQSLVGDGDNELISAVHYFDGLFLE